jgi:dienelactone hydrolase
MGAGGGGLDRHLRAASLLLRFQAPEQPATGFAAYGAVPVTVEDRSIAAEGGPIRARLYRPEGVGGAPGLVLVHGVHRQGIDERRLGELARVLASAGVTVLTPEVQALTEYHVDPRSAATIGRAATALAAEVGRQRVGVMGISFGGGLSLVAAADPALGARIAFVVTVGAHHDLRRVARWYGGEPIFGPGGESPGVEPHPYGAGALIYATLDDFFAPADLPAARAILGLVLAGERDEARARLGELSERGRAEMERIFRRREDEALRARYLGVMDRREDELLAASPAGRLSAFAKPVFLLHGEGDPIVPSTEALWLAAELPEEAVEGRLVTPFLRHAEQAAAPSARDRWALVQFMSEVLAAAELE